MEEKKDIRDLLDEEIERELKKVSDLDPGCEKHADAVKSLKQLYDLRLEEEKIYMEDRAKTDQRDYEDQLKRDTLKNDQRLQKVKIGVDIANVVLPLMFYGAWLKMGLKFEEKGVFTSTTLKSFFSKLRPTK